MCYISPPIPIFYSTLLYSALALSVTRELHRWLEMVSGPRASQKSIDAAFAEYNNYNSNNYNSNNSGNNSNNTTIINPTPLSTPSTSAWNGMNILTTPTPSTPALTGFNPPSGLALSAFVGLIHEMNAVVKRMRGRVVAALAPPLPHEVIR